MGDAEQVVARADRCRSSSPARPGTASAGRSGPRSARGVGVARRCGVGAGSCAAGVGDGVGVGLRRVGLGDGLAVGAASAGGAVTPVRATLPDRRPTSRPRRATAPPALARGGRGSISPPLATTNPTDKANAQAKHASDAPGSPASAEPRLDRRAARRSSLPSDAAQVARAVDVAARQADELLLSQRLRDRLAERGAAVGRVGRLDGRPARRRRRRRAGTGRSAGVRRAIVADRWRSLRGPIGAGAAAVGPPVRRARRRIVVHALSLAP